MTAVIKYVLLTAIRDKFFIGLLLILLIAFMAANFLGSTALVENKEMGLAYSAFCARLILIVGLIIFTCFHVRKAFDNREIEVMISRPISRIRFVIAYFIGFCLIPLFLIVVITFALLIFYRPEISGLLAWSSSLLFESILALAFSLFCSLILSSAVTSTLVSLAFIVLSRLIGFFSYILESPYAASANWYESIMHYILKGVSILFPRLDLFGQSSWLIYGFETTATKVMFLQTLVYIPLLLAVTCYDFVRKEF